ncbi:hypothetical protein HDU78_006873 [Chytriomyces hyalinus]|nr:hypothetical protein HDU78_006873 [Chytriomyces hyalinus]
MNTSGFGVVAFDDPKNLERPSPRIQTPHRGISILDDIQYSNAGNSDTDTLCCFRYLFQEGVMVAKKDFNLPKHNEVDVPNLHVIKALQSLESRGLVNTRFSWQYYYYFLNDAGIEYLRKFLHLPVEIVPRTHIKTAKPAGIRPGREERPQRERREGGDGYRRRNDGEKKEGASGDFRPEFRGGVGRGGPRPAQE